MIDLTREEIAATLQILDAAQIRGLQAAQTVLGIAAKLQGALKEKGRPDLEVVGEAS